MFIEPGRAPVATSTINFVSDLRYCQKHRVTIIPQTSGLLGGRLVDYANPKYIERVADDFPDLNIICGHGCYPFVREAILAASRRDTALWLAPDGCVFHLGRDDWLHAVNSNLLGFADRFLFASAYPLNALKPQIERFHSLGWKQDLLPEAPLPKRHGRATASRAPCAGELAAMARDACRDPSRHRPR